QRRSKREPPGPHPIHRYVAGPRYGPRVAKVGRGALTVVLVVLAVVWAVVLIPPWLRSRAEGRPGDSIGAFHRQLTTLERTSPARRSSRSSRCAAPPTEPPPAGGLT